jgi:hypothetical protein
MRLSFLRPCARGRASALVKSLGFCCLLAACDSASEVAPSEPDADTSPPSDAASDSSQADDAGLDAADLPDAAPADAGDGSARDALPMVPCTAVAPTSCPTPAPRYADVAKLIERRCAGCHSPLWTGPWPLDSYQHVADWQDDIRSHLLTCTMPPTDGGGPLPEEESTLLLTWIRCGLPM